MFPKYQESTCIHAIDCRHQFGIFDHQTWWKVRGTGYQRFIIDRLHFLSFANIQSSNVNQCSVFPGLDEVGQEGCWIYQHGLSCWDETDFVCFNGLVSEPSLMFPHSKGKSKVLRIATQASKIGRKNLMKAVLCLQSSACTDGGALLQHTLLKLMCSWAGPLAVISWACCDFQGLIFADSNLLPYLQNGRMWHGQFMAVCISFFSIIVGDASPLTQLSLLSLCMRKVALLLHKAAAGQTFRSLGHCPLDVVVACRCVRYQFSRPPCRPPNELDRGSAAQSIRWFDRNQQTQDHAASFVMGLFSIFFHKFLMSSVCWSLVSSVPATLGKAVWQYLCLCQCCLPPTGPIKALQWSFQRHYIIYKYIGISVQ